MTDLQMIRAMFDSAELDNETQYFDSEGTFILFDIEDAE